jgi:hypothetical protein
MQKLLYTMQVRGRTSRPSDPSKPLRTTGSAVSCILSTTISASGVRTDLTHSDGELAFFESELWLNASDEFQEAGEITFGDGTGHTLKFSSAGNGHVSPGFEPGMIAGAVSWQIEAGEGQFRRRTRLYYVELHHHSFRRSVRFALRSGLSARMKSGDPPESKASAPVQ